MPCHSRNSVNYDRAIAFGEDPVNISVALQIVLRGERVPYSVK
jgi:hypothetical protein